MRSSTTICIMRQSSMSLEIQAMDLTDLPFEPGTNKAAQSILVRSEPDEDAVAEGETGPFGWMDLRDVQENFSRLIDADEVVLTAAEATLVLWYPLAGAAIRLLRPSDGKSFTRGELVRLIDETYREVYRLEANSQSSPTPPIGERGSLERDDFTPTRFWIPSIAQIRFNMLAGREAGMNEQTLFHGSSRAGD